MSENKKILHELLNQGTFDNNLSFDLMGLLFFTLILFIIGFLGVGLNNRDLLTILMALELMYLSAILNFIFGSIFLYEPTGQLYALIILALAAAESALGLAFLIVYYRQFKTILLDDLYLLRG